MANPLVEQLGRHLRWPSVDLRTLIRGNQDRHSSWLPARWWRTHRTVPTGSFSTTLTEVFPCFSSVVRQMPGYKWQRRDTAHILPKLGDNFYAVSPSLTLVWKLWVWIPESLPTKVVPPIGPIATKGRDLSMLASEF